MVEEVVVGAVLPGFADGDGVREGPADELDTREGLGEAEVVAKGCFFADAGTAAVVQVVGKAAIGIFFETKELGAKLVFLS